MSVSPVHGHWRAAARPAAAGTTAGSASGVPGAVIALYTWRTVKSAGRPDVSGAGGCGAGNGEVPAATREVQRGDNQEEGGPLRHPVREADEARGGRHAAAGDVPDPEEAGMAVHPWRDQPAHAGPCRTEPLLAQAFPEVGERRVVEYQAPAVQALVCCVHRDASCGRGTGRPLPTYSDITLIVI